MASSGRRCGQMKEDAEMSCSRAVYSPLLVTLIAAGMAGGPLVCPAQTEMSYMLLEGSTLTEDCAICDRPAIIVPLRGTFQLVLREQNPLFTTYDVQEIRFQSQAEMWPYVVTGQGTYEIGGEVALEQRMLLNLQINDLPDIVLEHGELPEEWSWPMIDVSISQEPVDPMQVFSMHLIAAPVREIWFSTGTSFTSGALQQSVSSGDLLSHVGRVVKSNFALVGNLGIMPIVPDLGLDAADIAPGGEVLFSIKEDVHSETLGLLQDGDLLSERGRIVRTNQELTSSFGPMPPAPDVGLDAVLMMDNGKILFSIEEELFSEGLGVTLRPGDLLSDKGVIIRTNEQLLAEFEPVKGQGDVGLDAIHVWPGGEIWFSTEVGFQSGRLGAIGDGDLLSDTGSIVLRNLELLAPFAPLEKLGNFGLDSLFLVIEEGLPTSSVREIRLTVEDGSGDVRIEWLSDERVFQVEQADEPGGPYVPLGDISPEMIGTDKAARGKAKSFYRIREW